MLSLVLCLATHQGLISATPKASTSSSAQQSVIEARTNPKDGQLYVWIPPGKFQMGCSPGDTDCIESERPSHTVTISNGFWMGRTEVTVAAFKGFTDASTSVTMPNGQHGDQFPVVNVTWTEAEAYCRWAGGRLPTEAEWEYAARGGVTAGRYGSLGEIAWYAENSSGGPHQVATKMPNRYGLYDMLGNVFEWASDWYGENYYRTNPSLDPHGPEGPQDDPHTPFGGPGWHKYRVLRGGNWGLDSRYQRASCRLRHDADQRSAGGGLRCVVAHLP